MGVDDADIEVLDENDDSGSGLARPMPMWQRRTVIAVGDAVRASAEFTEGVTTFRQPHYEDESSTHGPAT